ncbi:hypothetical protein [Kingella potus]|uniref:hypothetical protein n=1 Tax=Kingella potus TaxID=265175 RepID=UPI000E1B5FFB|nr:hypothetical protein [Kingella potus]UOP00468.1 hypothetical protein LVJ84_11425 [Kingella potus]
MKTVLRGVRTECRLSGVFFARMSVWEDKTGEVIEGTCRCRFLRMAEIRCGGQNAGKIGIITAVAACPIYYADGCHDTKFPFGRLCRAVLIFIRISRINISETTV